MLKEIIAMGFFLLLIVAGAVILFQQPSESSLKVVVHDAQSGAPVAGASVRIYDQNQNLIEELQTDKDGTVSFNLKPGYYYLNATSGEYTGSSSLIFVEAGKSKSVELPLKKITICVEKWNCTDWGPCVNGVHSRSCVDLNNCGTEFEKPPTTESCGVEETCQTDADCNDWIDCTKDSCVNGTCVHTNITECISGDNCCPSGCYSPEDDDCGPLVGKECTKDSDCSVNTKSACMETKCVQGFCSTMTITSCVSGDGCCPLGCTYSEDTDCPKKDECSSDADCEDGIPCTKDVCSGDPKVCHHENITSCSGSTRDGCCPSGCTFDTDKDCDLCETDADCDKGDPCKKYLCAGSPKTCQEFPIVECKSNDGCCPKGCTSANDNDCKGECTYWYDCNDDDPCTIDKCVDGKCSHTDITECNADEADGCCPSGCSSLNDLDCENEFSCSNDADCNDDDACTVSDRCVDHQCTYTWVACSGSSSDGCCPPDCTPYPEDSNYDVDCGTGG